MNRTGWQRLARDRIRDAKVLLAAGRSAAAYYLAGYAVECGLKACILAHVEQTGALFEDKKYSEKCWTHNLEDLVELAGLKDAWKADTRLDADLKQHWVIVKDWKESSRYERKPRTKALELYRAITDQLHGVLPWVKRYW